MASTPEGLPIVGHDSWFGQLFRFLRYMLSMLLGGTKIWTATGVIVAPLPANTYANGTSGIGATLTANANGAFPTRDGIAPVVGQVFLVTGEAAPANNGLYRLSTLGSASVAWVLTRVVGLDASATFRPGMRVGINDGGLAYGGQLWEYTGVALPTVGTTALTFLGQTKLGRNCGVMPASRLPFTVQPTNTNTLVIGAWTVTFVTALGAVAATTQVLIGVNAAATLVNLINALNADPTSKGTTWQEQTVPATLAIFADAITTTLRIRGATSRGGLPIESKFASTALSTTIAGGGVWTNDNLSLICKASTDVLEAANSIVLDAAHIAAALTAGGLIIELPFTPSFAQWQVLSTAGVLKSTITDTLLPVAGGLQLLNAGAVHVVATDILSFWAQQ